jgi:hypothetical protein
MCSTLPKKVEMVIKAELLYNKSIFSRVPYLFYHEKDPSIPQSGIFQSYAVLQYKIRKVFCSFVGLVLGREPLPTKHTYITLFHSIKIFCRLFYRFPLLHCRINQYSIPNNNRHGRLYNFIMMIIQSNFARSCKTLIKLVQI